MRQMGIMALYPKANTSRPGKGHTFYPYLLRGLDIDRPNQVRATDICYVPMARGFVYVVAIMDWFSRYGAPEIFNTDQCTQFTSDAFTGVLKAAGIRISMDGKGRWVDNVFVERLWRSPNTKRYT